MEPLDTIITAELDKLYRFAYRETGDAYLAEDLTQDIVLQAYTAWSNLREPDRAVPWLWGIAHNLARQCRRKIREISTEEPDLIRIADGNGVSWKRRKNCLRIHGKSPGSGRRWRIWRRITGMCVCCIIWKKRTTLPSPGIWISLFPL